MDDSRSKKEDHFVNLYRLVHGTNEGLWSARIRSMNDEELQASIDDLAREADARGLR